MRQFFLGSLVVAFFLAGCAAVHEQVEPFTPLISPGDLWKIRLARGEEELFAGLLVLGREKDQLSFQVLDATGITLLSASVDEAGAVQVKAGVPKVVEGRLAGFLGKALQRIFFVDEMSCSTDEAVGMLRTKEVRWGGVSLWKVEYWSADNAAEVSQISLDQWWPRPDLFLEKMAQ